MPDQRDFPLPPPITDPIAIRIARYWLMRPDAGDTAVGIREWWLADSAEAWPSQTQVEQALRHLLELGVAMKVDRHSEAGQSAGYQLAIAPALLRARLPGLEPGAHAGCAAGAEALPCARRASSD